MGDWMMVIRGQGIHHNGRQDDVDEMGRVFLGELESQGHRVDSAKFMVLYSTDRLQSVPVESRNFKILGGESKLGAAVGLPSADDATTVVEEKRDLDFSDNGVETVKLFKDGDQWCALIGVDLQEGISGFGVDRVQALKSLIAEMEDAEEIQQGLHESRIHPEPDDFLDKVPEFPLGETEQKWVNRRSPLLPESFRESEEPELDDPHEGVDPMDNVEMP